MAYNITVTFPQETHDGTNTIQLVIVIPVTGTGTDQNVNADDQDLKVTKWGRREFNYDLEDALMVPGTFQFTVGDKNKYLHDKMFQSESASPSTSKVFIVQIKYNGAVVFEGKTLEDGVNWDDENLELDFTAAPEINTLNELALYDADNAATNPFSYTGTSYYSLKTILEDLFTEVDSQLTFASGNIKLVNGFSFWGMRVTPSDNAVLPDISIDNIYVMIDPLFFDSTLGIKSAGDLLRKLAQDFGCYAGVVSNTKAFFKMMWYYDSSDLQTLGTILTHRKSYPYQRKYYVKTTTQISDPDEPYEYGVYNALSGRRLERSMLSSFYSNAGESPSGTNMRAVISTTDLHIFAVSGVTTAPAIGDVYSNNGSQFTVKWARIVAGSGDITTERTSGINDPLASGTLTRVSGSGDASISYSAWSDESGTYDILQLKHPFILGNTLNDSYGDMMALFWYSYLSGFTYLRVDYFLVAGVNYDFTKNFNEGGAKYQIVKMVIDYELNETEIWALYLGEV